MSSTQATDAAMEKEDAVMEDGDNTVEEGGHETDAAMKKEDDAMMEKDGDAMMEKEGDAMMDAEAEASMETEASFRSAVIAGSSSPLLEFDQRDYEAALTSGRLVVLYFYANWCPLCKIEFTNTKKAFDEWQGEPIVGFRVHFNDNNVTPETENVAREFGVAYQHTKVFVRNGERVLKSPETWGLERYGAEFAANTN